MRGMIALVAGLLIAASAPALAITQQDYADCAQTSDVNRSIAACTRIIDDRNNESPVDRAGAYLSRGNHYVASGERYYVYATSDYTAALHLDPKNVYAYASRAIVYFRRGDRDDAIADYRSASAIDASKIAEMTTANPELKEIAGHSAASLVAATPEQATSAVGHSPDTPANNRTSGCSDILCGTRWSDFETLNG